MDINRKQLARQMAAEKGWTISGATQAIDDITDMILQNLSKGDTVSIYGFGCFDILERKAHIAPNPQTGEMCMIPPHWIPRFYPGIQMRRVVKALETKEKATGDV